MKRSAIIASAEPKLAPLVVALVGAIMASSLLITGDSVTVSAGDTLPQILFILATTVLAGLVGWQVLPWRRPMPWPAGLLVLGIGLLTLSTVAANWRADGRAAWNNYWHVLALLFIVLIAAQVTRRPPIARAFLQMVILCGVFQSTYAVHQYFVSMPAARAEYLADPDAAILKAQIDAPPGSEIRTQYENRLLSSFEPAGTFVLANSLAVLLSGVIVALGVTAIPTGTAPTKTTAAGSSTGSGLSVWFTRGLLVLIAGVWLLTKSRSGFLAVVLVGSIALIVGRRARVDQSAVASGTSSTRSGLRWGIAAVVVCLLIGSAIALLASDQLVLSEAPKSLLYRLEYWQATSKMILDFPLTGVGLGNFQSYYPAYKLPAASEVIADPHNWLFDLAANCSLPFLVVAVVALAWTLRTGMQHVQSASETPIEMDARDQSNVNMFWVGALVAFVLVGALQLLLGELIDFDATMLGFFATLASWWFLRHVPNTLGSVRRSALLAVITMLVCLLASGCWQASGLALPLAILLAICCPSQQGPIELPWFARRASFYVSLVVSVIALLTFVWQTWQPVQASWALEQQAISAWQQGQTQAAMDLVKQSVAADRMAAAPRRLQVQFAMEEALSAARRASPADFNAAAVQVDAGISDLLTADSISNLNHGYAGECNLALAAGCAAWNPEITVQRVTQAAEHYRQARLRYPTSVALRAQAAVVQAWLDLRDGGPLSGPTKVDLDEAFHLSEVTPHTNRKLASQQVFLPPPLAEPFAVDAIVRPNNDSPWAQAEPLCEFLRKL